MIWIVDEWKPRGPKIMRKLWSIMRERTRGNEKRKGEDSSYTMAIEGLLRATARKNDPKSENVHAPQCFDLRQSGRVLEFQNRDLWIQPTDLSSHFPFL